ASRLHGFTASRLHGFTASRLHGFTASRLSLDNFLSTFYTHNYFFSSLDTDRLNPICVFQFTQHSLFASQGINKPQRPLRTQRYPKDFYTLLSIPYSLRSLRTSRLIETLNISYCMRFYNAALYRWGRQNKWLNTG
ncbi:hypothetical protein ACFGOO_12055, partial [Treponema vincentii]